MATARPCAGGEESEAGNIRTMPERGDQNSDTGLVPVFGTWRNIYAAVIVVNLIAMALVYLFSRFPY